MSQPSAPALRAVVLIGGESARMGTSKATLDLPSGLPLLDHVIMTLQASGLSVALAGAGPTTASSADLQRLADVPGVRGPLAGILAALHHDPAAAWIVCACDLPGVEPDAVQWLIQQRDHEHWAILPRVSDLGVEPLFALYEPGALDALTKLAGADAPAPSRLQDLPGVKAPWPPVAMRRAWTNVNTPEAFASFVEPGA